MLHQPNHWVAWLSRRNRRFVLSAFLILPLATAAAEQPDRPEHTLAAERTIAAEAFLTQKLVVWQQRLKLEDWNITFKLVHFADLKPKTLGNIHWDSDLKKASMSILCPADYKLAF